MITILLVGIIGSILFSAVLVLVWSHRPWWNHTQKRQTFRFEEEWPPGLDREEFLKELDEIARKARERVEGSCL